MRALLISIAGVLLIAIASAAQPQPPDTLWTKTYGGHGDDIGYSIDLCDDGGYILTGFRHIEASQNIWVVRTDRRGEMLWETTIDGYGFDEGRSIKQTTDGGYIVAGYYGNGIFNGDGVIAKFDSVGEFEWERVYYQHSMCYMYSVIQGLDGSYIVTGNVSDNLSSSLNITAKIDGIGNWEWIQEYSLGSNSLNYSYHIIESQSGGYIICGGSGTPSACTDGAIWELSSNGDSLWVSSDIGSIYNDYFWNVTELSDGSFICSGYTYYSAWLIKTSSIGSHIWGNSFYYSGNTFTYSHVVDENENIILAGYTDGGPPPRDALLIATDSFGEELWHLMLGGEGEEKFFDIVQTTDGNLLAIGYTTSFGSGGKDIWLVKFGEYSCGVEESVDKSESINVSDFNLHPPSPNPFNAETMISFDLPFASPVELSVYDITGRRVAALADEELSAGNHVIPFNGGNLVSGVYFVRMEAGDFTQTRKCVLIK